MDVPAAPGGGCQEKATPFSVAAREAGQDAPITRPKKKNPGSF